MNMNISSDVVGKFMGLSKLRRPVQFKKDSFKAQMIHTGRTFGKVNFGKISPHLFVLSTKGKFS